MFIAYNEARLDLMFTILV